LTLDQLAACATAGTAILALLWWVFQVQRTAGDAMKGVERIEADRKEAVKIWGARLENAESNAEATRLLAVNVQNLSERFSEQMGLVRGEVRDLSHAVRNLETGKVVPARRARSGND
jgi:hypothetical protein